MKFALLQTDTADWQEKKGFEKIIAWCNEARNNNCRMAFAPGGFSAHGSGANPCAGHEAALNQLAMKLADTVPLFMGSPDSGSQCFLLQNGLKYNLPPVFEFQNRKLIFSENVFEDFSSMPVWRVMLQPTAWQRTIRSAFPEQLAQTASNERCWVIHPNLSGSVGTDIYGGQSLVFTPNGKLALAGGFFKDQLLIFDTDDYAVQSVPEIPVIEAQWKALVKGTADFVTRNSNGSAALGLSGGMDSALVACIACEALGKENLVGLIMPSVYTSERSISDAEELARNLGIKTFTIPITPMLETFTSALTKPLAALPNLPHNLTRENLQARIRGVLLMAISNATGALVLNTGNKSEGEMGYCTLYGDTVGALAVIGDIYKTRVYELAEWYCQQKGKMVIPRDIFTREPSAELAPDQKDSDTLPPYDELDACLQWLANPSLPKPESARMEEIRQRRAALAYKKRYLPPALKAGIE